MLTRNLSPHMMKKKYKTFVLRSSGLKKVSQIESSEELLDRHFCSSSSQGILYFLYSKDRLYYVGKASQQGWRRVFQHQKNRHKNQWNKFVILCVKKKYLTTLESLLIAVANPPGNKTIPKVPTRDA